LDGFVQVPHGLGISPMLCIGTAQEVLRLKVTGIRLDDLAEQCFCLLQFSFLEISARPLDLRVRRA
jgi:hypothetical protein